MVDQNADRLSAKCSQLLVSDFQPSLVLCLRRPYGARFITKSVVAAGVQCANCRAFPFIKTTQDYTNTFKTWETNIETDKIFLFQKSQGQWPQLKIDSCLNCCFIFQDCFTSIFDHALHISWANVCQLNKKRSVPGEKMLFNHVISITDV